MRLVLRPAVSVLVLGVVCVMTVSISPSAAAGAEQVEDTTAELKNLVVIHTDEHNFRTLGCYRKLMAPEQALMWGDAVVETPHIDWIAQQGALCTSFYANTPVCSPSRAAFVTGRYPQNTPVTTNNIALDDDVVTFAELLKRQGYATGYAGKWHLDGGGKPQWAPERKFGFEDNRFMFNRGHWKQLEQTADGPRVKSRKGNTPSYNVAGADQKSFTTDFLTDRALEFIDAHKQQPFCYMISIPDPHGPDTVRPPYDTMFKDQTYVQPRTFDVAADGTPRWGAPAGRFSQMASYYGMVKCIDDNVGRVLDHLRREHLLDKTIVVFTADHGDLRGEHHRQNKGVPYEASAKVPFVIWAKDTIAAGTVVDQSLSCVDFLPTILSLMKCPTADLEQGRDAASLLTGSGKSSEWKDVTFLRSTSGKNGAFGWVGVVSDRYKLIYSPLDDPWLFDLQEDPDELKNFFRDPVKRDIVRQLSRELADYGTRYSDPYLDTAKVKADLRWAIEGQGEFKSTVPARKRAPASAAKGANRKQAKKK